MGTQRALDNEIALVIIGFHYLDGYWDGILPSSHDCEVSLEIADLYKRGGQVFPSSLFTPFLFSSNYRSPGHQTDIAEGRYFIENVETARYLFQTGDHIRGSRGDEGGWTGAPSVVGSDSNYCNLTYWNIISQGDGKYFIENQETQRYLFQTGDKMKGKRGDEGSCLQAPAVVGSDANYCNLAYWKLLKQ